MSADLLALVQRVRRLVEEENAHSVRIKSLGEGMSDRQSVDDQYSYLLGEFPISRLKKMERALAATPEPSIDEKARAREIVERYKDLPMSMSEHEQLNRLRADIAAALKGANADGWQPIETAPKDWSSVLLFDPEQDRPVIEGYYSCEDGGHDRWLTTHNHSIEPTHWRPLPPAPQQERKEP